MNTQLLLYFAAIVVLFIGAIADPPRFNVTRCIALAFALLVIAQIVGR